MLIMLSVVGLLVAGGVVLSTRMPGPPQLVGSVPTAKPDTSASPAIVTVPRPVASGETQTGEAVPTAPIPTGETPSSVTFVGTTTDRAAVRVNLTGVDEAAVRDRLAQVEGVLRVATVTLSPTTLGGIDVVIAQVDPDEFRPFTPDATANYEPLWDRIEAGDVAVTHEFGTAHEVPLGSMLSTDLQLPTGEPLGLRVGAFATNGTPPLAQAIVLAGRLPGSGTRVLLVALDPAASPTATVELLAADGIDAEAIPDPRLPRDDVVIPVGGITPDNVWDHLALCESSGDWQINTGNGYYGGVQFLPESWAAVGGRDLPHQHTREEQIYRASLLWQIQGWEAWPQCARKLGLIVDPPPEPTATPAQPVSTEPPS